MAEELKKLSYHRVHVKLTDVKIRASYDSVALM